MVTDLQMVYAKIARLNRRIAKLSAGQPINKRKQMLEERDALIKQYEQDGLAGGYEGDVNNAPDIDLANGIDSSDY